jgi:UrcA family protein
LTQRRSELERFLGAPPNHQATAHSSAFLPCSAKNDLFTKLPCSGHRKQGVSLADPHHYWRCGKVREEHGPVRMSRRSIACAAATAMAGSLLATTGSASIAQPVRDAAFPTPVAAPTRYVPFRDLPLATKGGQSELFRRVAIAVDEVCPPVDEEGYPYDDQACLSSAWHSADWQVSQAVRRAKAGLPTLAMTITLSGSRE